MLGCHSINFGVLNYAETLYHLGLVLYQMRQCKSALEYLNKSLTIRRKELGDNHLCIARTLTTIGEVKGDMRDYEGAIHSLGLAQVINRNAMGRDNESTSHMIKGFISMRSNASNRSARAA